MATYPGVIWLFWGWIIFLTVYHANPDRYVCCVCPAKLHSNVELISTICKAIDLGAVEINHREHGLIMEYADYK